MDPIIPAGRAFPLDARARSGYNGHMAHSTARVNGRTRRKAKKRERPLGAAIGWGLAVTFAVALIILLALRQLPGAVITHLFELSRYAASPTLRNDALYQQYSERLNEMDALLGTPLSLLCGGLTLGWLAPRYATRRRILLSGTTMAFAVVVIPLALVWLAAVLQQNAIDRQMGGYFYPVTAPPDLIVRQILWAILWVAIGTGGTWLGLRLRDRKAATVSSGSPATSGSPRTRA